MYVRKTAAGNRVSFRVFLPRLFYFSHALHMAGYFGLPWPNEKLTSHATAWLACQY